MHCVISLTHWLLFKNKSRHDVLAVLMDEEMRTDVVCHGQRCDGSGGCKDNVASFLEFSTFFHQVPQ
jgi:hypothetical protein